MSEYGFLSSQAVIQTFKKKKVSEYVMQLIEGIEEYLFTVIPKVKKKVIVLHLGPTYLKSKLLHR